MKANPRLLVAYDGSSKADQSVDMAISIADRYNGSILVLHVAWEETDPESRKILNRAAERIRKTKVRYTLKSERSEYIPRRIVRIATDENCDLIVMGSRGLNLARAWVLGSVSQRVIEDSPIPILIVK